MRRSRSTVLALSFLLSPARGQTDGDPAMPSPAVLSHSEVHTLRSTHVDQEYLIQVGLPVKGWRPSNQPARVVYVLDANLWFATVVEMSRLMHQLYGELPPLLVVGVAYPTDDVMLMSELRTRDFTPSSVARPPWGGGIPGREPTLRPENSMGGADAFLDFLQNELRPFIREHYEVAEKGDVLFGSSLGGLFALHALLTRPNSFDGYIVASPAIWWDDGLLFKEEAALSVEEAEGLDARVFLTVGGLEEDQKVPGLAVFKMVSNLRSMAARLGAAERYPKLELTTKVFEDETHTSVVAVAITRGLRTLF